jgi:hypothetical protein
MLVRAAIFLGLLATAGAALAQPPAAASTTPPAQGAAPAGPQGPGAGRGRGGFTQGPAMAMSPALAAFDKDGPLKTKGYSEGPGCTIFRPETLSGKSPIVLWGNGTGQTPARYATMLNQLASYGFVVAAADTTNPGTAREMLGCLDYLTAENGKAGSPYEAKLDLTKVGASGHSQGGGGAIMAGRDARIKTTAPIMPYTLGLGWSAGAQTQQHGPMFMTSGGNDTIARPEPNQKPVFDQVNVPIFWATLAGASHLVPMQPDSGAYRPAVIAWFRYQLMGDAASAAMFAGPACTLCTAADWSVQRKGGA